jgi:two-component system LytT family response regulator
LKRLIRALIVDDEPLARDGIRLLLAEDPEISSITEASNGKQAVSRIRTQAPDLVFLDVQMPEMDGFSVLRKVGPQRFPAVIFVTAYDRYAVEAFEIQAVDYLLKPFTKQRFHQALGRAKLRLESGELSLDRQVLSILEQMAKGSGYLERLAVKTPRGTIFVNVKDVDWIEAAENYVRLHVGTAEHLIQTTMNAISRKLDPSFFIRIHRSRIVNINKVQSVNPAFHGEYLLKLNSGAELRSGRVYNDQVKALLRN